MHPELYKKVQKRQLYFCCWNFKWEWLKRSVSHEINSWHVYTIGVVSVSCASVYHSKWYHVYKSFLIEIKCVWRTCVVHIWCNILWYIHIWYTLNLSILVQKDTLPIDETLHICISDQVLALCQTLIDIHISKYRHLWVVSLA